MSSTFEERRKQQEYDKRAVQVSFSTVADLAELTDEDLCELGRFVVGLAADVRELNAEGKV